MASDKVLYKAKDGTLINLSTKVINNTTSTSETDALSAAQGKILNDLTFQTRNGAGITNTVDWNTLTSPGCYKVQMASWGNAASYHGPNEGDPNLYSYGLLYVLCGDINEGEHRTHQIYFPHKVDHIVYMRMSNGGVWHNWHPIFSGITKASIGLGNVNNTADSAKAVKSATTATKLGSSTVGSASKPIYLNAGTATACSSTVGGASKPVYMNGGTITACSSTVGSSTTPVYMQGGSITACTGVMKAPKYSTTDLTPGVSALENGQIYIVYYA